MADDIPDLLGASRAALLETHVIHDFDADLAAANHHGCYGTLIKARYRALLGLLRGRRILDCGCGFGTFTRVARDAGCDVHPVDIDEASIALAQRLNQVAVQRESVYATSLPPGSRDVAVCFDSIQHLDLQHLLPELQRLGVHEVLIYDSNVDNPLLAVYRKLAGHEEHHERNPAELIARFAAGGYRLRELSYENVIALPISGGYQRRPLPVVQRFPAMLTALDGVLLAAIRALGLARWLTFRFLIILERDDA